MKKINAYYQFSRFAWIVGLIIYFRSTTDSWKNIGLILVIGNVIGLLLDIRALLLFPDKAKSELINNDNDAES